MEDIIAWWYWYCTMLVSFNILMFHIFSIARDRIDHTFRGISLKTWQSHISNLQYRGDRINELSKRLSMVTSREELDQVTDEMREYRNQYILDRKNLFP